MSKRSPKSVEEKLEIAQLNHENSVSQLSEKATFEERIEIVNYTIAHGKDYHDKEPDIPIQTLCQLLKVSRSGYYKWHNHIETVSETENKKLMKKIKEFHRNYNGILGYRRMTNFINRQLGTNYNKKRIRRLMKILGIRSVIRRVRHSCTKGGERFY